MNSQDSEHLAQAIAKDLADIVKKAISKKYNTILKCPKCGGELLWGRQLTENGIIKVDSEGIVKHRHDATHFDCPTYYFCINAEPNECGFEVPANRNDDLLVYLDEQKEG